MNVKDIRPGMTVYYLSYSTSCVEAVRWTVVEVDKSVRPAWVRCKRFYPASGGQPGFDQQLSTAADSLEATPAELIRKHAQRTRKWLAREERNLQRAEKRYCR